MTKNNRNQIIIAVTIFLVLVASMWGGFFGVWRDKLVDLLFTAKPASSDIVIVAIDEVSIQAIGQWPWPRSVFGSALNSLNSATAIGIDVNFKEPSGRGGADDDALVHALEAPGAYVVLSSEIGPRGDLILPIEKFKINSAQGFTNVVIPSDGVVRRFSLYRDESSFNTSFAMEVAKVRWPSEQTLFRPLPRIRRINYRGPNETFASISFLDVVENKIPRDFFKNKIVLIGVTAPDLHDYHQTPFGIMSGVEIQANTIQTITDGAIFKSKKSVDALAVVVLVFVSVAAAFGIKSFPKLLLAEIIILIAYDLAAFLSFDRFFIVDLFYPNLAVILGAGVSVAFQYITTHKEKKFIQDSFSRYLAPQVVVELMKDPSRLRLGGERKTVTILFSDIRGFTTISEKMSPEHLTKFMNRYLTAMSQTVFDHDGVVDKYIGDAVMAFWGAPIDDDNHALHGVLAALDMMKRLEEFNRESERLGEPVIDIGIGLNSGEVTVGNMGSEKRFDYTVMGDNVNLASRLEGLNKTYATHIIISQATVDALGQYNIKRHSIDLHELGEVQVKGKAVLTKIYKINPVKK